MKKNQTDQIDQTDQTTGFHWCAPHPASRSRGDRCERCDAGVTGVGFGTEALHVAERLTSNVGLAHGLFRAQTYCKVRILIYGKEAGCLHQP